MAYKGQIRGCKQKVTSSKSRKDEFLSLISLLCYAVSISDFKAPGMSQGAPFTDRQLVKHQC